MTRSIPIRLFESQALKLFAYQYENNTTYRSYCDLINVHDSDVERVTDIPFLPIQFFKTHNLNSFTSDPAIIFRSSKTTGQTASQHPVHDLDLYIKSFEKGFAHFYGNFLRHPLQPNSVEPELHSRLLLLQVQRPNHCFERRGNMLDPGLSENRNHYRRITRPEPRNNPRLLLRPFPGKQVSDLKPE